MDVSVVSPVLNERGLIEQFVDALLSQSMPPTEIVIADGGSTDGCREILDELAAANPRLRVIEGPGGISENRNAAISASAHEIVACVDVGCIPEPDWLERITAPFAAGEDWVSGFYLPQGENLRSTCAGLVLMSVLEEVNPDHIIPPGASQAFRKKVWLRVGGFPEGMSAAEDTLFGERARAAGFRPYFQGDAMVQWRPPHGLGEMAQKAFGWGKADGAARLRGTAYQRLLLVSWGSMAGLVLLTVLDWRLGLLALVPIGGLAVYRTRFKYRWARGVGKYLLIPFAEIIQRLAQSLGWLVGASAPPTNVRRVQDGR